MLKRSITFENFDGETVTEEYYFNLSKSELLELEVTYDGGLAAGLQKIVETQDARALITEFKRLVLIAYGQKSADGKRFIKSDQLREEFSQTPAYDALFMELATDDNAAAIFIRGIVPKDMAGAIDTATENRVVQLPPPPPPAS